MASRCDARNHEQLAVSRPQRPPTEDTINIPLPPSQRGSPILTHARVEPSVKRDEAAPRPPPAACSFSTFDGDPLSLAALGRQRKDSAALCERVLKSPLCPSFSRGAVARGDRNIHVPPKCFHLKKGRPS